MSALVEGSDGKKILITKGAPESLLPICSSVPASAQTTVNKLFASGARVFCHRKSGGRDGTDDTGLPALGL